MGGSGRRRALVLAAGFGVRLAAARAQPAGWPAPFEQRGIEVEVRDAANGVVARDRAYREARRRAWLRLRAALQEPEAPATEAEILAMVASIIVEQEHVAPRAYRGRLTIRFDPDRVAAIVGLYPPDEEEPD
ncbi:hypothetical protein [Paracraurococcus lichenis]|uniref:Uncharacterized protein n=1 Tax=Paracraurococcus lichenis TaxID=3064888 RepID=A0ABT9EBG3_9PROT|nr:hypothetical protein [Paracraurococcus sp. LOR1-02]MDO9713303.1 hypothetical protein [Paracraurococcus sp. LOR1-02]